MTFYLLHFLCYAVLTILLLLSRKQSLLLFHPFVEKAFVSKPFLGKIMMINKHFEEATFILINL